MATRRCEDEEDQWDLAGFAIAMPEEEARRLAAEAARLLFSEGEACLMLTSAWGRLSWRALRPRLED